MTAGPHQPTTSQQLAAIVASMHEAVPELFGVMIASVDGLPVAHDLPEADAERIAAMAATTLGLGARIAERSGLGSLTETVVRGTEGHLVVYSGGNDVVLVMSGPLTANLTLMRIEARVATAQITSLLTRR